MKYDRIKSREKTKAKNKEDNMRKLMVVIAILVVILLGMIIYQKVIVTNSHVRIQEIENIENYIQKIYMWKEITNEALPCFENINQANDIWVWEVVKKNLEDYEFSYEQIQEKAKELFGEDFAKQFPKEGTSYLGYDSEKNLYFAQGIDLDEQEDLFLLNQIEKLADGYEIEIIEYLEDYSNILKQEQSDIIIRNVTGEEIGRVSSKDEGQVKELVKNNCDKLNKKKLILKKQKENLYVEKVEQK